MPGPTDSAKKGPLTRLSVKDHLIKDEPFLAKEKVGTLDSAMTEK